MKKVTDHGRTRPAAGRQGSGTKVTKASLLRLLGHNMRRLRDAAGLTQTEAAERAGLDLRQWQRIETRQSNATLSTLAKVAAAFEVKVAELFKPR